MAVRQALRITKETTAGVFPTTPAAGTQANIRVTNPVTDMPKPIVWDIRDAASSGRRVQTGSDQNQTMLKFSTPLYFSQAGLILPAFRTPVAGLPGLTTFTIDMFDRMEDSGATRYFTRMLGQTPESMSLKVSNSGNGVIAMLDLSFVGRTWSHAITSTDFPDPALTAFPNDPVHLKHLIGGVALGSQTANFKSFSIDVKNVLDVIYDENPNPIPQFYGNRDVNWSIDFRFNNASLRADYENVIAKTASFAFTDGTTTITFNLQGANYIDDLGLEKPFDKAFYLSHKGHANIDIATGTEMTLTVAP
jgi:hypothetical protein